MPGNFMELVMFCIASCSLKILWNGEPTEEFFPTRGIRQGDPISPYIFILCMERLGHCIRWAVEQDDLVLFGEASEKLVEVVLRCIEMFINCSSQRISKEKTKLYCWKNVWHLNHAKVNSSTFLSILEKVKRRLSMWKARNLTLRGRLTLSKAVIKAIPSFYMQMSLLPKKVCNEIESLSRYFIWGSNFEKKKPHLLAWDKVWKPKCFGGTGLRRLHSMNLALLMKLGWGIINKKDDLWLKVLRSKYKCGSEMLPKMKFKGNALERDSAGMGVYLKRLFLENWQWEKHQFLE
ncbi:putative ribonuclease H protein At1g65750 family [Senna tora]|uniref:Putative ribonuclease H protein At1g65750 family n=1 Tax=Senna tora TaxID=362788 RepID=A0A834WWF8_9FABA|nr:putative ribonuclease H protein At1g65750 family [Senna tora]